MSNPSTAISWSLDDILDDPMRFGAEKGTYTVNRIHGADTPLPAQALGSARVRILDRTRIQPTKVVSWAIPPLDSETMLRHDLASYVHLPDNWDGEGATAPSQCAVDDALTFLNGRPVGVPLPRLDQGFGGAVGVYWDSSDSHVFAEATFDGDGTFAYFATRGDPGATADKCGSDYVEVSAPWPEDMLRILRSLNVE